MWEPGDDHDGGEDDLDPEEAERRISAFIEDADVLPGAHVDELADQVVAIVGRAWSEIEALVAPHRGTKLLATQLLLGQRVRRLPPDDPQQWRLHAAVTLLSGMVGPGGDLP